MDNTRGPAAASKLLNKLPTGKPATLPGDYRQFLPFHAYKVAALLAWGYSDSIERLPDYNYIVHLPSWSTQLGTTSQRIRDSLQDALDLGLLDSLTLRRSYATVRLRPMIKEEDDD